MKGSLVFGRSSVAGLIQQPISACFGHKRTTTQSHSSKVFAAVLQSPTRIKPDTDVESAVELSCISLARAPGPAEAEMIRRLKENWYETAVDVANMTKDEADDMKVPFRLCRQIQKLLDADESAEQPPLPESNRMVYHGPASNIVPLPKGIKTKRMSTEAQHTAQADTERRLTGSQASPSPHSEAVAAVVPSRPEAVAEAATTSTSVAVAAAASEVELHPDIMQRRCPRIRQGRGFGYKTKTSTRIRQAPYALKDSQMSPKLAQQMEAFHRFCTVRFFGQQGETIAERTAANYAQQLRGFLGWLHQVRGVPLEDLHLQSGLPSPDRVGVTLAFDYMQWLISERNLAVRSQQLVLQGIMQAAKFLYHDLSKVNVQQGDKSYSDVQLVQELRGMLRNMKQEAKVAPPVTNTAAKWLDWPEYLQLVHQLKQECAGMDAAGRQRPLLQVASSVQRYLMFALLACIPDRQRTLRELRLGKTLFKDEQGRWVIRHGPKDYKTGKIYGERPPLVVTAAIFPELEAWITTYRAYLNPQHDFLFSRPNGTPFDEASLSRTFSLAAFRLTGKKTTPHLVRDMIVTYLRGGNASERELEALAIYMGHSIKMQRESYDRRTKAQKVEPAVDMLQQLNARAALARNLAPAPGAPAMRSK